MGLKSSTIITVIFIFTVTFIPLRTYSVPFIVFHEFGILLPDAWFLLAKAYSPSCSIQIRIILTRLADACKDKGVTNFTDLLTNWSGSPGYCLEIGDGPLASWFMSMPKQVSIACEKVKKISELSDGYNIVGLSQGNLVARGVIEFCDGPPVKNLISLAGPHAGTASVPFCGSAFTCFLLADLIKLAEVYSDFVQECLAPADYIRIPTEIDEYRKGCKFLPKLNNEFQKNATYKKRFESLENLVLIMFEQDGVLVPKETSLFGYYADGSWSTILPAEETMLYKEDWIGLKTMNEAGKVKFVNVSGGHLQISVSDMKKYILPYLVENKLAPVTTESSLEWSSSYMDHLHFTDDWQGEEKLILHHPY